MVTEERLAMLVERQVHPLRIGPRGGDQLLGRPILAAEDELLVGRFLWLRPG